MILLADHLLKMCTLQDCLDKKRQKMSKSLGNSPDPIQLMDEYGADGVRAAMLFTSPAGNDLLFDESLCEQGRNFSNKIWNAYRLVSSWEIESDNQLTVDKQIFCWFENKFNQDLKKLNTHFKEFRISDCLMILYKLIWSDFCSNYLEIIKPSDKKIDILTYEKTLHFFEQLLILLHPFMPFVTEEIWQNLKKEKQEIVFHYLNGLSLIQNLQILRYYYNLIIFLN